MLDGSTLDGQRNYAERPIGGVVLLSYGEVGGEPFCVEVLFPCSLFAAL
jgi:hypothetical protein